MAYRVTRASPAVDPGITDLAALDATAGQIIIADGEDAYSAAAPGTASVLAAGSTTSRTLAARFADIINAKDYGVVGDGATNDTAALEAASLAAVGKTLFIPPGMNCLVQTTVDFDDANTRILAHGVTFTQSATWSGTEVVRIGAINVTLEGLKIVGTEDAATSGIVGTTSAATGMRVRFCEVTGAHHGIVGNSNSDVQFEANKVHDCTGYPMWCQNLADTQAYSDISILNNDLDTSHLDPATADRLCVLVRGGATYPTTDVRVVGNTMTMPLNPTDSTVIGCELRYIDGGVYEENHALNGAMNVSVAFSTDVTVSGNPCDGQTFYGIEVASECNGVTVIGNTIDGKGRCNHAIGVQGTGASTRLIIANNTIKSVVNYGVFVSNQWDWVSITGNDIYMDTAGSLYGIFVQAATGASENLIISNNLLNGTGVAKKAIYIDDSSNVSMTGNLIYDWTENPLLIQSNTGTVDYITFVGNIVRSSGNISTTGAGSFGTRIQIAFSPDSRVGGTGTNWLDYTSGILVAWGTGSPEGVITAAVGSTFHRSNGGASTSYYVKESGTGNTGWVAK